MKKVKKMFCIMMVLCMAMLLSVPVMAKTKKPSSTSITLVKSESYGTGTVSFNKASRAKGYQVQFATNTKFTKNKKTVTTSGTTATKNGLIEGKKYYVRVRAYNKNGKKTQYGSWSKTKSFTVKNVDKPGTSSISSVSSNNAGNGTVSFSAASKATKYEVQFATNTKFTSNVKKTTTTSTSASVNGLSKGKTYYVRVRAYNQSRSGDWSSAKSFKVETRYTVKYTQAQWIKQVESWCDYMVNQGDWIYSNSNNRKDYTIAIKESHRTNCALMVSHVLQRAGIIPKGKSFWIGTDYKIHSNGGYEELCKYADVIDCKKVYAVQLTNLQPGDIVLWDGHVNIYYGKDAQGNLMWYDASTSITVDKKDGSIFPTFIRTSNDVIGGPLKQPHKAYRIVRLRYKK